MLSTKARATETRSLFKRTVGIAIDIAAPPERVWALLTDAENFTRWNSTVARLVGPIAAGATLEIRLPGSPRFFTPTVTAFEPVKRMVWQQGTAPMFQGTRLFELAALDGGGTRFSMTETFSGLMLPLIPLPDMEPVFEAMASDLKKAAEAQPI